MGILLKLTASMLMTSSMAIGNELVKESDRLTSIRKTLEALGDNVPRYEGIEERGLLLKCDEKMISAQRLGAWANSLTPKDPQEHKLLTTYVFSKHAAVRYIVILAIAHGKSISADEIRPISFSYALFNTKSNEFIMLVDRIARDAK